MLFWEFWWKCCLKFTLFTRVREMAKTFQGRWIWVGRSRRIAFRRYPDKIPRKFFFPKKSLWMQLSTNLFQLESTILILAKRATNRNNVATEFFFWRGDFVGGILSGNHIQTYLKTKSITFTSELFECTWIFHDTTLCLYLLQLWDGFQTSGTLDKLARSSCATVQLILSGNQSLWRNSKVSPVI